MDSRSAVGFLFALAVACQPKSETKPSETKPASTATASAKTEPQKVAPSSPKTQKTLADLDPAKLNATAPEKYRARFETTKGNFVIQVTREWSTHGADQFYNLVRSGFYNETRFYRAVKGFMVQFGIHGDPKVSEVWREARIKDDPPKGPNQRGYVTFAKSVLQHSRTTQVFINTVDNPKLDPMGFAPFGRIDAEGMKVVDSLYNGYGDSAPEGKGPEQMRIFAEGNPYLEKEFPSLDFIKAATIE